MEAKENQVEERGSSENQEKENKESKIENGRKMRKGEIRVLGSKELKREWRETGMK